MNTDLTLLEELGIAPPAEPRIITVPGEPLQWARTRGRGTMRFTPQKQRSHKGVLTTFMLDHMAGAPPLEGPVRLDLLCAFLMPKKYHRCIGCGRRHSSSRATEKCLLKNGDRNLGAKRQWAHTKPQDRDNLLKQVQDAGNGVLYLDDKQVVTGPVETILAAQNEPPFTRITFRPLGDYPDGSCA